MRPYADRVEAGRRLGELLVRLEVSADLVLALPRGGVPVAAEVARALSCPLDVLIVRKVGVPGHSELGMGAVSEHDVCVLNEPLIGDLGIGPEQVDEVVQRERAELERRMNTYRGGRAMRPVIGREIVLVDDGIATGFTARAAIEALREMGAASVVLAVPVAAPDTMVDLDAVADRAVAAATPVPLRAVGQWYRDFRQVTDGEVAAVLERFAADA